jgi:RecA/RadA recombinase
MATSKDKSLTSVVSESLKKTFDIDSFKKSKFLDQSVKFKPQRWIPLSKAFQDVLSIPGIPMGHITLLRGHSDTGKTTAMLEAAVEAQKMGILPIFIVTEIKWNWDHAMQMGFELEPVVDKETGEMEDLLCGACLNFHEQGITYEDLLTGKYKEGSDGTNK